jgi:inorganic pyrophosphatase
MTATSQTTSNGNIDDFFNAFETMIEENGVTIDRPRGSAHPRFPSRIYQIDYGYINETKSQDGEGIDVYQGDEESLGIVGIICIVDTMKKDSEIKVLFRCSEANIQTALKMSNNGLMHGVLMRRNTNINTNTINI